MSKISNTGCIRTIALSLAMGWAGFSGVALAGECAKYPIAPRTLHASAAEYATSDKFSLDAEQILVFDYGSAYGGLGKFRNPYFISNYANALYRDYLATDCKDERLKASFLRQADYLVDKAVLENDMALWKYPFRNDHFDLPPGWISGIGQARIASVLLRAYGLTNDNKYKEIAYKGMATYQHSLKEGGVVTKDDEATWIEETASHEGNSHKILNGHITAISGIIDFGALTSDPQWDDLVRRALLAVKRDLPLFDAGFTSYYSLGQPGSERVIAPRADYNSLHVEQLLWLYEQTRDSWFLQWASRLQAYEVNGFGYSAKGSVDPIHHGPNQAAGLYGIRYWSHAKFPTWFQVTLPKTLSVKGFWIDGNGQKATPRDFSIEAFINGKWKLLYEVTDNSEKRRMIYWDHSIDTDRIRLNISKDNGNRNTALQAAMPILTTPQYAAVTNSCNYKITNGSNYNVNAATDADPTTAMKVYCSGWVVLPNPDRKRILSILFDGDDNALMDIEYSLTADNWKPLGTFSAAEAQALYVPPSSFIKLGFNKEIRQIRQIKIR
ncbi:hypothetical protein H0A71_15870 [Alcaligenaceae bacterium]|nr:hypothetical protein [Alcaligenaceae bacterium]